MNEKKKKKVSLNKEIFDAAMKQKKYNLAKLGTQCSGNIQEGILRRARKEGKIDPDILEEIARRLNVDPRWLSGQYLDVFPFIQQYEEYFKLENHPYITREEKKNSSDFIDYFLRLLSMHGVSEEQYRQLSAQERIEFHQELNLSMQTIISKYFSSINPPKRDCF